MRGDTHCFDGGSVMATRGGGFELRYRSVHESTVSTPVVSYQFKKD